LGEGELKREDWIPYKATYGEKYDPAMKVQTAAEAAAYFEKCVFHTMRHNAKLSRDEAETIERQNIGYWFGYQTRDKRRRLAELYGFDHPFIGSDDSPEEIVRKGIELGVRLNAGLKPPCGSD
jgi:hypothetical protein